MFVFQSGGVRDEVPPACCPVAAEEATLNGASAGPLSSALCGGHTSQIGALCMRVEQVHERAGNSANLALSCQLRRLSCVSASVRRSRSVIKKQSVQYASVSGAHSPGSVFSSEIIYISCSSDYLGQLDMSN